MRLLALCMSSFPGQYLIDGSVWQTRGSDKFVECRDGNPATNGLCKVERCGIDGWQRHSSYIIKKRNVKKEAQQTKEAVSRVCCYRVCVKQDTKQRSFLSSRLNHIG